MTTTATLVPIPEGARRITLLYLGRRISSDYKQLVQTFATVDEQGVPDVAGKHMCWAGLITDQTPMIGSIYSAVVDEKGGAYTSGKYKPVFVKVYDDERLVRESQLEERVAYAEHRARTAAKAEAWGDLVEKTLEPLRAAYHATNPDGRRTIKLMVLEYLETGMPRGFGKSKASKKGK